MVEERKKKQQTQLNFNLNNHTRTMLSHVFTKHVVIGGFSFMTLRNTAIELPEFCCVFKTAPL